MEVSQCWLFLVLVLVQKCFGDDQKPNIIVIIADDMGFNDVSFHGSDEIPTPNIDALAYNGVILNSHYTQALCTPSRAAFLTGKYPIHTGMQQLVILEPEPWGLPLNETILPQHLKRNGYSTHAVGKWHLGFFRKEYTPTYRGFDTHYGYWQGLQDYYSHMTHATYSSENGYDMRRNMEPDYSANGKYSTTLFTEESVKLIREHDTKSPMFLYLSHLAPHTGNDNDPLQAPDEEIAKFAHIQDPERRIYAVQFQSFQQSLWSRRSYAFLSISINLYKPVGVPIRFPFIFEFSVIGASPISLVTAMVSMLDQSVGTVISALREKHMLENSIILFISDNGANPQGTHANHGSNFPFRGTKHSAWEGAQRNVAAIWSPRIKKNQRVSNQLMHLSDWLPTFYSAAGLDKSELPPNLDGLDMWEAISEGIDSPRTELLYNIDDVLSYGGIRQGKWKYVYGSTNKGKVDGWFGDAGKNALYHYDPGSVLNSKVNSALTGVITYQQMREKNGKKHFSTKLIDREKIERLRSAATIKCPAVGEDQLESTKCNLVESPCLFNIEEDPCERINLASIRPNIVTNLERAIMRLRKSAVAPRNVPRDPKADPSRWNGTWTNWVDCENDRKHRGFAMSMSPIAIALVALAGLLVISLVVILLAISLCRRKDDRYHFQSGFDEEAQKEAAKMIGEQKSG